MTKIYSFGKLAVAVLWIAVLMVAAGFVPEPYARLIIWIGAVTAALHIVEVIVFLSRHSARSTNIPLDAAQVLVFGVLHLWPLTQREPRLP